MQKILFFIDDSGVLTDKSNDVYFIYGGMYFLSNSEKNNASIGVEKIKNTTKFEGDELKFSRIRNRETKLKTVKRIGSLVNSCSVSVSITSLNRVDLDCAHSIGKYKDYMLKMLIKSVIIELVNQGKLNPCLDLNVELYIDQQATRTNGYYNLKDSIQKELNYGMHSGHIFHPPIWEGLVRVTKVKYCVSHNHYLLQAADIIAGYVRLSCNEGSEFHKLKHHIHLSLPKLRK